MGRVKIKNLNYFIPRFRKISENGKLLIGLTGGIGSGKSTALSVFAKKGFYTISSDEIVKELLTLPYYYDIILSRYPSVQDHCNVIDKTALARLIFSDIRAKRFVEGIIHPAVVLHILKKIKNAAEKAVVVEIPLLFETNLEQAFDIVVCVCCEREKVERRLVERGMRIWDVRARMKNQLDDRLRMMRSDAVISNNSDLRSFIKNVKEIADVLEIFSLNKIYQMKNRY
ncbi:MAG: dephospho-CoA kinase [Elusimicrobiales bacterium]